MTEIAALQYGDQRPSQALTLASILAAPSGVSQHPFRVPFGAALARERGRPRVGRAEGGKAAERRALRVAPNVVASGQLDEPGNDVALQDDVSGSGRADVSPDLEDGGQDVGCVCLIEAQPEDYD